MKISANLKKTNIEEFPKQSNIDKHMRKHQWSKKCRSVEEMIGWSIAVYRQVSAVVKEN